MTVKYIIVVSIGNIFFLQNIIRRSDFVKTITLKAYKFLKVVERRFRLKAKRNFETLPGTLEILDARIKPFILRIKNP